MAAPSATQLDSERIRGLLSEDRAVSPRSRNLEYVRVVDDWHEIPRGTVLVGDAVVAGYPKIGRILRLETGLRQQFSGPFRAEEKIDGYNVRAFRCGDRVLALSRGGFVCPFTTDRLADLLPLDVFETEPDLVVCGEVAGPENPYTRGGPPDVREDVRLYVFDLMRLGRTGFLPAEAKDALARRHGLPVATCFGDFVPHEVEPVRAVLRRLDAEGREGLVFKAESPVERRAKYTTARVLLEDFRTTGRELLDLPAEYFTNRLLRLVLFADEDGGPRDRLHRELGEALVEGLVDALRQTRCSHRVQHRYRCRFRNREAAEDFVELLGRGGSSVQIVPHGIETRGGFHVLEFDRVHPSMTGLLTHLLGGGTLYD